MPLPRFALVLFGVMLVGCEWPSARHWSPAIEQEVLLPSDAAPAAAEYPHLHNLQHFTPRIFSGAEPHGDESFAELIRLGVKTIVSVDGAEPDVARARQHGLRYIHIPLGYDGVDDAAALSIAAAVRETEGPMYFHCHHGKHRGPAAAAIACVTAGAVQGKAALALLERAGTSKDYAGLWRDVKNFQPPPAGSELPALVEIAEVGSLAAAMAKIDRAKDNLALSQQEKWSVPHEHPDIAPVQEALILREGLHEMARHLASDYDDQFEVRLKEAEQIAIALEQAVKASEPAAASEHFATLQQSCKACHAKYRD